MLCLHAALQGYPTQLLPMIVSGVPSIHICMDFIPELLAQPQIDKQVCGCVCVGVCVLWGGCVWLSVYILIGTNKALI